jgi:hypothetical protein
MLHIQTAVVNNPTFIELQHTTLKHFVDGSYDFTVFNDAKDWPDFSNFNDGSVRRAIQRTCERLNIPCINLHNEHHKMQQSASHRTADSNNAMLEIQKRTQEKYLVLDSDMFPIAPFKTNKYTGFDVAYVPQTRSNDAKTLTYIWNGIYYFDMAKVSPKEKLSWAMDNIDGVWTDTGGAMYYFLEESKNNFYKIQHRSSCHWSALEYPLSCDTRWLNYIKNDVRNVEGKFYAELFDSTFFHFRAGGNWEKRGADEYGGRVDLLADVVYSICRG